MKNYSFEKLGILWEINLLDEFSDQTSFFASNNYFSFESFFLV